MTRDEAKTILLIYRPGTADAADPDVEQALAMAARDPELADWLEDHCQRQQALRGKFRGLAPPAGLKEQIISEHAAARASAGRRWISLGAAAAVAALVIVFAIVQFSGRQGQESTFAVYARQMAGIALRGYVMDRTTDSPAKIRAYLSSQGAPADFHLPPGLAKAQLVGCAVETWGGAKVSMICFRTGQALPPGQASDLWLFVAKAGALKNAPTDATPEFSRINRLALASWSQNGDVYLMGIEADHKALQSFL